MTEWSLVVELDKAATDEQAGHFAAQVDSVRVSAERQRTTVSTRVTASGAHQAIADGLDRVSVAAMRTDFDAVVVGVTVKAAPDRHSEPSSGAVPELAGIAEIREILAVNTRQQAHQLTERDDFPDPVEELRAGRIWRRSDVEDFGRGWSRKRGRPAGKGHSRK